MNDMDEKISKISINEKCIIYSLNYYIYYKVIIIKDGVKKLLKLYYEI